MADYRVKAARRAQGVGHDDAPQSMDEDEWRLHREIQGEGARERADMHDREQQERKAVRGACLEDFGIRVARLRSALRDLARARAPREPPARRSVAWLNGSGHAFWRRLARLSQMRRAWVGARADRLGPSTGIFSGPPTSTAQFRTGPRSPDTCWIAYRLSTGSEPGGPPISISLLAELTRGRW